MRLATFVYPDTGLPCAAEVRADEHIAYADITVVELLAAGKVPAPASGPRSPLAEATLLSPAPRPRAPFAVGLDYADYVRETGAELPERPLVFTKLPSSSAPTRGTVRPLRAAQHQLDDETELAAVIGAGGCIAGYAVADDLSARDLQIAEPQWTRAKGFNGAWPWGPWITTTDAVPDPRSRSIVSYGNGERRQDATTRQLVFGPEEIVAFVCQAITLEPGDLILTGTPAGVGIAVDPPRYLVDGDIVRCEIELLGTIEHRIAFQ
jgi:acylpyruvate hydrolase